MHAPDLVFVDESGSNRAMCPRYGYAPKGKRCHGRAPRNRGRNTSILAAMSPAGRLAPMTVEGSTNKEGFLTHLENVLCPALRPGQTVVMDNLAVHKNETVRGRIEARGCRLWFLPAYSPDFNPIEHAFAKLKQSLRKAKARTQGNARSRHLRRAGDHHHPRRARLVQALPISVACSIILKTAVRGINLTGCARAARRAG